jgi:hypothetical protein
MAGRKGAKKDDVAAAVDPEFNGAFKAEVAEAVKKAVKGAMDELLKDLNDIYDRKFAELQQRVAVVEADSLQLKDSLRKLEKDFTDFKIAHPVPPVAWPVITGSGDPQTQPKSLLAAVHIELADKQRRRTNVVVSGIKPIVGVADADLFLQLCEDNLPLKPHILRDKCRRLGKPIDGKIQPLLVPLTSEDGVAELLGCSSQLRKAVDTIIRSSVYINADLTPAESLAAWESRNRRREKKVHAEQLATATGSGSHSLLSPSASVFVADASGAVSSF